jgi:hypothetical protein
VEISLKTKTRLSGYSPFVPISLVFVLKLISTVIGQNPNYSFYACVEEGCSVCFRIASGKHSRTPFLLSVI